MQILKDGKIPQFKGVCPLCGCAFLCEKGETNGNERLRRVQCPTEGCGTHISVVPHDDQKQLTASQIAQDAPRIAKVTPEQWWERLGALKRLEKAWDGYNADPPNDKALENARMYLALILAPAGLETVYPLLAKINPSVVGGVGFTFRESRESDRYAYAEFRNTGNLCTVFSQPSKEEPVVRLIEDVGGHPNKAVCFSLVQIQEFLVRKKDIE